MKYSRAQIVFHWLTAGLILLMAATGLAYSYDLIGDNVLNLHQIAGQLLIIILTLRLATRLIRRSPVADPPTWDHKVAHVVHIALYLLMIAYVATGYVSASALTNNVMLAPVDLTFARSDTGELLLEIHYLLKWVLLGLVGLHIAGALKHLVWDKDAVFSRMTTAYRKD